MVSYDVHLLTVGELGALPQKDSGEDEEVGSGNTIPFVTQNSKANSSIAESNTEDFISSVIFPLVGLPNQAVSNRSGVKWPQPFGLSSAKIDVRSLISSSPFH